MKAAAVLSQFDEVIDRRGSNSMKWDGVRTMLAPEEAAADPLPMWVTDMDAAAEDGVFGYPAGGSKSYVAAVTGWQQKRFGWEVAPATVDEAISRLGAAVMRQAA